jgi:phosphoribosylglycinamide formyltransferase-1
VSTATPLPRKRVAVLLSGRGSNMVALLDATRSSDYPAEIVAVLSDKSDAGGLAIARGRGLAAVAVQRGDFPSKAAHEAALIEAIEEHAPDLICLAGYMRLLSADFVRRYAGRILNIHPSLLPLFPGLETHQRAIDAGVRLHGCTVHFVDEGMDEGAIVAQAAVPVLPDDTAATLSTRVLAAEHRLYPQALALVASGRAWLGPHGKTEFSPELSVQSSGVLLSPDDC